MSQIADKSNGINSKLSASQLQAPEKPNSTPQTESTSSQSVIVHEKEFKSPAARVQVDCLPDRTLIGVNFTKPFNGILTVGKLETSKCRLEGAGEIYYELEVFHNDTQCDTEWDSANNSISNTLLIRFHPSLETGSDIAKNLMCRLAVGEIVVGRRPIKTTAENLKAARAKLARLKAANNNNLKNGPKAKVVTAGSEINQ